MRRDSPNPDPDFSALGPLQGSQGARCFVQETPGFRHMMLESKDGLNAPCGHPSSGLHAACGTGVSQQFCSGVSATPHAGPQGVQWINLTPGGTVTPEGVALSHDSYANGLHMQATPGGRPMQCSAHNFVQSPDVAPPQARRPGRERTAYAWQSMYPQDSSQGLSPTFRDNTPVGAASRLGQHGLAAASHDSPCGGVSVASSRLFHSQPASATPLPQQPFRSHVNMATAPFLGNAAVGTADEPDYAESSHPQAEALHNEPDYGASLNEGSVARRAARAEAHRASYRQAASPAAPVSATQTAPLDATNVARSQVAPGEVPQCQLTWPSNWRWQIDQEQARRAARSSPHLAAALPAASGNAHSEHLSGNRPETPQQFQGVRPFRAQPSWGAVVAEEAARRAAHSPLHQASAIPAASGNAHPERLSGNHSANPQHFQAFRHSSPQPSWDAALAEEASRRASRAFPGEQAGCPPSAQNAHPEGLSGTRAPQQQFQARGPSSASQLPTVQRQDNTPDSLPPIPTANSSAPMAETVDSPHPGKKLRTPSEARAASSLDQSLVPDGFPTGPLPCDRESLTKHVNVFTTNVHTSGGGYSVSRCRSRPNKSIGDRVGFACSKRPRVKGAEGCGWNVSYEETTEGWVLMSYVPHMMAPHHPSESHHGHELEASAAVMRATAAGRCIPDELADLMSHLDEANFTTAEIDRALESRRRVLGLERTWNYKDIYSQNASTTSEKTLDASNLLQLLEERQRADGLAFFARNSSSGALSQVFVELAHGFEDWAVGGTENVLLFDPTWGTNRAGFKLCCFTTVSSTGQTVILAFCLLMEETHIMFEWAFRCFAEVFRTPPRTLFTDGDYCIATAFASVSEDDGPWAGARHLLCVFHISKNFYEHIKRLFGSNKDAWEDAHDMFWSIAKESDAYSRESFGSDWEKLLEFVDSSVANSPAKQQAMEWLGTLGARSKQWALRFVWEVSIPISCTHPLLCNGSRHYLARTTSNLKPAPPISQHCTWGIHSTQRAESIHANIKRFITARHMITSLMEDLEHFNESSRDRRACEAELLRLRQAKQLGQSHPVIQYLARSLCPHAMKLVHQQEAQANQYATVSRSVCPSPH